VTPFPTTRFVTSPEPRWLATKQDIERILRKGGVQIVDARSSERFHGRGPEPATHKGHIPGAMNIPHDRNLDPDTLAFVPLESLRKVYEEAGVRFDQPVVTT
jgi:thiosulfate/3-mercaptopyruvate sulfurtransferase